MRFDAGRAHDTAPAYSIIALAAEFSDAYRYRGAIDGQPTFHRLVALWPAGWPRHAMMAIISRCAFGPRYGRQTLSAGRQLDNFASPPPIEAAGRFPRRSRRPFGSPMARRDWRVDADAACRHFDAPARSAPQEGLRAAERFRAFSLFRGVSTISLAGVAKMIIAIA